MEFDLRFNGSPAEFGVGAHQAAVELWRDRKMVPPRCEVFEVENWAYVKTHSDANPVGVRLWGTLRATEQVDNKIRVISTKCEEIPTGFFRRLRGYATTHSGDKHDIQPPKPAPLIEVTQFAPLGRVDVYKIAGGESRLHGMVPDEHWENVEPYWNWLREQLELQGRLGLAQPTVPYKPHKPSKNASRDEWFEYKSNCDRIGVRFSHKQLAAELGISPGHACNMYALWTAGRDD